MILKILKNHLFRSPFKSSAAIMVVSLSLLLISIFFFLGAGSEQVLKYFETRPQVTAFLKDEAKPQDIELIKAKMTANPNVVKVDLITKEKALEIYRDLFKDKPLLLEMATAKQLPASLEVSTKTLASLSTIAQELKAEALVEDVDYQEDVISSLSIWVDTVRKFGLFIAVFLIIVSTLTVLIVIGLKISQKQEEIEILKLLGATTLHIRLPYFFEGIVYGIVSGFIAWCFSYLLIWYISPFLASFFDGIPLVPVPVTFMLQVLAGLTGLGILTGFIGSFFAVSRFSRHVR